MTAASLLVAGVVGMVLIASTRKERNQAFVLAMAVSLSRGSTKSRRFYGLTLISSTQP